MRGQIFISYRRDDVVGFTGRLSDRLGLHFGKDKIFLDVSAIDLGVDFVEEIEKSVGACDVLIVVIGKRWLTSTDEEGRRRLDNPEDFVRLEIATALKRGIRVIPVLVDGASMPQPSELPDDLKALVRRQALEMANERFEADSERLIKALKQTLPPRRRYIPTPVPPITIPNPRKVWILTLAIIVSLVGLWIVSHLDLSQSFLEPPIPPKPSTPPPNHVTIGLSAEDPNTEGGRWTQERAREWAQRTGHVLKYFPRPDNASATLQQFEGYWKDKRDDIDVYMIDVTWPGIAAPHAVDLKQYFREQEINQHFPRIIQNNTVKDQLVGMPFFMDVGVLYYRTDLLRRYHFSGPPQTWGDLVRMAKAIQEGERRGGNPMFQGFVFEGIASESLTCNALEWIYSFGGGTVIDPDKNVTIDNPGAIKALQTARTWIGSTSPEIITTIDESKANDLWQAGNAAFMRNWPYYAGIVGRDPTSPVFGKFALTVLPRGEPTGENAASLGGWQLMVSRYSKHPDIAADLVRYLCSSEMQKQRAKDRLQLPTRPDLYKDPEVLSNFPWFYNILTILDNAIARPSTVTGADYEQLSRAIYENVNRVLRGEESPSDAVVNIKQVAQKLVH
jgi:trehalose/maltose transport system substrate-binding protein